MLFDRIFNNEHLIFIEGKKKKKTYPFIIVSQVKTPIYPHTHTFKYSISAHETYPHLITSTTFTIRGLRLHEERSGWEVKTSCSRWDGVYTREAAWESCFISCETLAITPELWERFVMSGGEVSMCAWETSCGKWFKCPGIMVVFLCLTSRAAAVNANLSTTPSLQSTDHFKRIIPIYYSLDLLFCRFGHHLYQLLSQHNKAEFICDPGTWWDFYEDFFFF